MQYLRNFCFFMAMLLAVQVGIVFAEGNSYSEATTKLIQFLENKSNGQAEIRVKDEIKIPESDFYFVLIDFKAGQDEKELSFVTNGKYITNALIELESGQNLAQYYETISKTVDIEVSEDEIYFGNPETAKVKIVIFSDFECPYCKNLSNGLSTFFDEHKDDIVIYYKHYPLSFHKNAQLLSKIYEAGKKMGYYWNMYQYDYTNKTYEEITSIFEQKLKEGEIGQFYKTLNSPEITQKIEKNIKQGQEIGVNGTPYMLVNGHPISGYQPELIKNLISDELGK
ncbi:MAG TPA: hypothetical protein DHM44_01665 [Flexistipes sinusarabici]|uniref:Thioredoxin-like fold domain-containing protein n=1 Tax=Flexistipes sinusarabici TaxID=2352 RepID=A0A3D5Q9I4_FLESI|nr:hypothetical protein [Flexistipes sinusarabici]